MKFAIFLPIYTFQQFFGILSIFPDTPMIHISTIQLFKFIQISAINGKYYVVRRTIKIHAMLTY